METPGNYLLKKISGYKTNGLKSMGQFDASHFEDVASIMYSFAEETAKEVCELLKKGGTIEIGGKTYSFKPKK